MFQKPNVRNTRLNNYTDTLSKVRIHKINFSNMILSTTIKTTKSARYFTLNQPTELTETIWIVLHGYGQLAETFIQEFVCLDPKTNLIVAPEGLHRFYKKGFYGDVVASWMTKEDRENDILDNIAFLDLVYSQVNHLLPNQQIKINVLGFSQGVATALRWVGNTAFKVNQLICWAGSPPPETELTPLLIRLRAITITQVFGDSDPFFNEQNQIIIISQMVAQGLNVNAISFQGKHELNQSILQRLA